MRNLTITRVQEIEDNLTTVRARMDAAAGRAGRTPDAVTLVAVSKTHPMADIEAAYGAGQRDFGENRLDEFWEKVEAAKARGLNEIRWHFIGTFQSRQTSQGIAPFALLHAVDRVKIANRLNRDAGEADCVLQVLLEINVSGEESKHGFAPAAVKQALPMLLGLPNLRINGLMTMAPFVADEARLHAVFSALRRTRDELQQMAPDADLRQLSMGMTNDYEAAIAEGATLVRIGSAIFGARD